MFHSLCIQQLLHFCFVQSWIATNAEFGETVSEAAVADRIHDVREAGGVSLPVGSQLFEISVSSTLETQGAGVVLEVGPEVESTRAVHRTSVNNNSFYIACSSEELLQICFAELVQPNINYFGYCCNCFQKRVYTDF